MHQQIGSRKNVSKNGYLDYFLYKSAIFGGNSLPSSAITKVYILILKRMSKSLIWYMKYHFYGNSTKFLIFSRKIRWQLFYISSSDHSSLEELHMQRWLSIVWMIFVEFVWKKYFSSALWFWSCLNLPYTINAIKAIRCFNFWIVILIDLKF